MTTACGLLLVGAGAASAHTELVSASPKQAQEVKATEPFIVSLTFTDPIDPDFANVVVVNAEGDVVASDPTAVAGSRVTHRLRGTPAPENYSIRYRVVSADGHPVDGEVRFSIAKPKPAKPRPSPPESPAAPSQQETSPPAESTPEPPTSADVTASSAAADDSSPLMGLAVGGLALFVALAGVLSIVARRRSSQRADG